MWNDIVGVIIADAVHVEKKYQEKELKLKNFS